MKKYVIYFKTTGEIVRTYSGPDEFMSMQYDDEIESCIEGAIPTFDYYVDANQIISKLIQNTMYDEQTHTLHNLPVPCVIQINCTSVIIVTIKPR